MGAAKDLFDVISKLIEFVKSGYVDNANSRRDFFNQHIDTTFQKMEMIHTDYLKNFTKLLRIKDKKEITEEKLVHWLKDKKIAFQTMRDRISQIEREVFSNIYFSNSFKKHTAISEWTLQFLNDISGYFNHGIYLDKMTWYSFLIECVESSLAIQQKKSNPEPAGLSPIIVNKPGVFREVENTVGIITSRYQFVLESYSNLRALCLK